MQDKPILKHFFTAQPFWEISITALVFTDEINGRLIRLLSSISNTPRGLSHTTFCVRGKLECLSLSVTLTLVKYLRERQRRKPTLKVKLREVIHTKQTPALSPNIPGCKLLFVKNTLAYYGCSHNIFYYEVPCTFLYRILYN